MNSFLSPEHSLKDMMLVTVVFGTAGAVAALAGIPLYAGLTAATAVSVLLLWIKYRR